MHVVILVQLKSGLIIRNKWRRFYKIFNLQNTMFLKKGLINWTNYHYLVQ